MESDQNTLNGKFQKQHLPWRYLVVVDQQNEFNYHYMPRQINSLQLLASVTLNEI